MSAALDAIQEVIAEVTLARTGVTRRTSRQVTNVEELNSLMAIAFAWIKSYRPHLERISGLPLSDVDSAFDDIIRAADKASARTTYAKALKRAKETLVAVRSQLTKGIASSGSPSTGASPSFSPLASDPAMQQILSERWAEIQICIGAKARLSATVMMGGLLETLLLARINTSPQPASIFTATSAPKDKSGKTLPLGDWKLIKMVDVAHELSWITKAGKDLGNVLRDFRNYIHPHKQHTDGVVLVDEDVEMFWQVTQSICRQVLSSVGKVP